MAPRLIYCVDLRAKLAAYFQHDFPETAGVVPIRRRADLARELDVTDSTLKRLLDGRNDGREDRLRKGQLEWLTNQLVLSCKGRLDRDQAYDLWRHSAGRDFARALKPQPSSDIMAVLGRKPPTLKVAVGEAPSGDGLQIFEEPFQPLPEEKVLTLGDQIRFEVAAWSGRCLAILASSPVGWYWMCPSEQHAGPTSGGVELAPTHGGYGLSQRGPHRVVAIELECRAALVQEAR